MQNNDNIAGLMVTEFRENHMWIGRVEFSTKS